MISLEPQEGRSADWHANQPTCPYTKDTFFGTITDAVRASLFCGRHATIAPKEWFAGVAVKQTGGGIKRRAEAIGRQ
ncbi:MAG: hypothetical protein ABIF82_07210 [Planctomycetota bacterium]